tara:strand:- start:585 stop:710 length:126 start_codon:yes stop_codon:yes gene_type:complete
MLQAQPSVRLLATACYQDLRTNIKDVALKNIKDKAKGATND